MNFNQHDVLQLFAAIPYLHIGKARAAERLLAAAVRDGEELRSILCQYPGVKYQALDFHYACLQIMGAASEPLVADLTTHYTWRGIVWASWLIALSPALYYAQYLQALTSADIPESNRWLVDLALHEIAGTQCAPSSQPQIYLHALKGQWASLKIPTVTLRAA
jgi:hypothetical protein